MPEAKFGQHGTVTNLNVVAIRVSYKDLVDNILLISCWHGNIDLKVDWRAHGS